MKRTVNGGIGVWRSRKWSGRDRIGPCIGEKGKAKAEAEARITAVYCRVSPDSTGSLTEQERQGIAQARARGEGHWSYMDLRDGYSLDRPGLKRAQNGR